MADNEGTNLFALIGSVLAAWLSWTTWHSIGWAIIHFLFGWFYVIYWLIVIWKGQ